MTERRGDFLAIEIDPIDLKLEATARRKRIPTLSLDLGDRDGGAATGNRDAKSEKMGGAQFELEPIPETSGLIPAPEPARRPKQHTARKRPLSLEVPHYLARELKIKAATEAVTVRYLILSALASAGYRVDDDELEEDGRRLR